MVRDYLVAMWANRPNLVGRLFLGVSPFLWQEAYVRALADEGGAYFLAALTTTLCGVFLEGATHFSLETVREYRKTRRILQEQGMTRSIQERYRRTRYCNRAGIRQAAREAGLLEKLHPVPTRE